MGKLLDDFLDYFNTTPPQKRKEDLRELAGWNKIGPLARRVKLNIFADLDGTLIKTASGRIFAKDKNDWVIREDVIAAIKYTNPVVLYIVSNQGGVEKGIISLEDITEKFDNIVKELKLRLPHTEIKYQFCTSNDKNDPLRKPNPGMIMKAFKEDPKLSLNINLMIGDASGKPGQFSDSDKKCAENVPMLYSDVDDFVKIIEYYKIKC